MRCPKCHYISFDAGDRCRNCGYEFSLTVDAEPLDLPIQTGDEPEGPLDDLSLGAPGARSASSSPQPAANAAPPSEPSRASRKPQVAGLDLPLFGGRGADDAPLVSASAVPRAPLAVRKSSPALARPASRARAEEPELDLEPGEDDEPQAQLPEPVASVDVEPRPANRAPASLVRRLGAALIDVVILGAIDVAVLYFTMRLCGLELFELGIIPKAPFLAFLLMQNGGYFVGFVAAGGQTIGKMVFGIRVVPEAPSEGWRDRVPFGTAVVRAVAWLISVTPAGLGLLPALFGAEHRALHDRLANTRVVRA